MVEERQERPAFPPGAPAHWEEGSMEKAILEFEEPEKLNDRRKSERVDLLVRVTYQSVDELFSEFARNINEGGLFIETDAPKELGTSLTLQFMLPGGDDAVEVGGIVVRVSNGDEAGEVPGMGVEFGDLNAGARECINELVRRLRTNG
jgi:type IV pilus assembly protein PilZ